MSEELQAKRSPSFTCHQCQAGLMNLQFITYFTWLDDELVTVPNFPAWICDVCGRREYDGRAVNWLSTLLSPNAGHSARKPRLVRPRLRRRTGHLAPPSEQ
ncbi:MAG: YgiT-type zinc finger protein [Anaerolineae bacterium]|jgi:YgiT-type zinc finger domain-containing protein|nr:YgiT-type zinc finger protein [Anaerolineae bacterium]